jgi:hypothetical protein
MLNREHIRRDELLALATRISDQAEAVQRLLRP